VWAAWNRHATPADAGERIVHGGLVGPVSESDRARAHRLASDAGALPPVGTLAAQERRLSETLGAGSVQGAHWPLCCDRLTTLVFLHGAGIDGLVLIDRGGARGCLLASVAQAAGQALDEALTGWDALVEQVRRRRHSGEGMALFHCRACGRVYGAYAEP
jgi:hypothetical protein